MKYYTLSEMAKEVGKKPLVVSNIQKSLELPVLEEGYSKSYLNFIQNVVSMMTFSVSLEKIQELLETEKKILRLLHLDSTSKSITWYLDGCKPTRGHASKTGQVLFLTGIRLGFPTDADAFQGNLDFGESSKELFEGSEMGEDVQNLLLTYRDRLDAVKSKIGREKPSVDHAIKWVKKIDI